MTNANSVPVIKQTATVEGDVTDIVFKPNRNGKEFVTVSIQKQELEFPINVRSTDVEIIRRMQNAKGHMATGREVWLAVEVTESPTPNGNGVFRDVTRILRASLDGTPQEPDTEDARPAPAPASAPATASWGGSIDERIAWNSSINNANEATDPPTNAEDEARWIEDIVRRATLLYPAIRKGYTPPAKDAPEPPVQAPEPNVDLPADPLGGEAPPLGDLDEPAPEVFEV